MKYYIFYQIYDDATFHTINSVEELKEFMEKEDLGPEDFWLIEGGQMISGYGNKHMPKEYHKIEKKKKLNKHPNKDKNRKRVLLPIVVPNNEHCWDGNTPCEHFDNEGGHPKCELNLDFEGKYQPLRYDKIGVPKPDYCKKLRKE